MGRSEKLCKKKISSMIIRRYSFIYFAYFSPFILISSRGRKPSKKSSHIMWLHRVAISSK